MKRIIAVLVLLLLVLGASAVNITLDTDGMMNISGNRTYPVSIYQICDYFHDDLEVCTTSLSKLSNFTASENTMRGTSLESYWNTTYPYFESVGKYYSTYGGGYNLGSHKNEPYFYGYAQYPEEPYAAENYTALYNRYESIKELDTNHPVYLYSRNYRISGALYNASQVTDVLYQGVYPFRDNTVAGGTCSSYPDGQYRRPKDFPCAILYYYTDDSIFAGEYALRENFLTPAGVSSIEELPNNLVMYNTIQAINEVLTPDKSMRALSQEKLRAYSYWSITAGFQGITYWGYKFYGGGTCDGCLYENATQTTYYNNFAGELTSPEIQDVLLLPTINYSWNYGVAWDNKVNFSVNPTRTINYTWSSTYRTGRALSYRLKYNSTSDKYYLIVANKLNVSVTPTITISGIGSANATTMGLIGTGNNTPGRVIAITGNAFSDTIDAYGGLIYEISNSSVPESPIGEGSNYTVCASGCNGTWASSSSGDNTIEDLGSHGIKPGLFQDNFNDNTEDWTESGGVGSSSNDKYWFNASGGSFLSSNGNVSWTNYTAYTDVNLGVNPGSETTYTGLRVHKNPYSSVGYTLDYENHKVFTQSGGDVTGLSISQYNQTLNLSQTYKLKLRIFGTNLSEWFDSIWLGSDDNYASTNNVSGNISLLIRYGNASYDNIYVLPLDASGNEKTSGNRSIFYNTSSGYATYRVDLEVTTPSNTNYTVSYRNNGTGSFVLLNTSAQTGNTSHTMPSGSEYQDTEILVQLNGTETAFPELSKISLYTQESTNTDTTSYHDETFNTPGTYYVTVNATNVNGTTQTINWTIVVTDPDAERTWTTGINGYNFKDYTHTLNNSCINTGDGSISPACDVMDDFWDNNHDGWVPTGNLSSQWNSKNGTLVQSSAYPGYLIQNVTPYENMRAYTKFQTNNLINYIDAGDLRGNLSRGGTTPYYKFYQFSVGANGTDRASIWTWPGANPWIQVTSGTAGLVVDTDTYTIFDIYGTSARAYLGSSYSNALSNQKGSTNTSTSIWLNGSNVGFGGTVLGSGNITWKEVRFVNLSNTGTINTYGNYFTSYEAYTDTFINRITINGTFCSGCNYTLKYRNISDGDYIQLGGLNTTNATFELPTPYYNTIDILLDMNASQSDTLRIDAITVETTDSDGSVNIYNTGYQYVLVNNTLTNIQLNGIWSPTWIIHWNSTSQKWENYKSGWSIRSSHSINKGDAVGIKVTTNNSILLTTNTSYNWTLSTGQNLVGLEFTKTLSQINTSVNTACEVNLIEYIEPETQTSYLYTCGQVNNASIEVKVGEGIWMNSTASKDIVRTW